LDNQIDILVQEIRRRPEVEKLLRFVVDRQRVPTPPEFASTYGVDPNNAEELKVHRELLGIHFNELQPLIKELDGKFNSAMNFITHHELVQCLGHSDAGKHHAFIALTPTAKLALEAIGKPNSGGVVFLSYSHVDSKIADAISKEVASAGVQCLRDTEYIRWGDTIPQSVREGLDRAAALIVILSPSSLKSQWVSYELGYATARKMLVLPYLTDTALEPPTFLNDRLNVRSLEEIRNFFTSNPDWSRH
jgi:hypothetical protein